MDGLPHLLTMDRVWIIDRNFPGAARRRCPAASSFATN